MKYRLTRKARSDLAAIWQYSHEGWGADQADTYIDRLIARTIWLATNESLWRARQELAPNLFSYGEGRHLIIFRRVQGVLEVLRFVHNRMDIKRHLNLSD